MTQHSPFFEPQSLSMQQTEIDRLRTNLEIFMTSNAGLTSDVLALRAINAELETRNAGMLWMLNDIRAFLKRSGYDTTLVDASIAKAKGE